VVGVVFGLLLFSAVNTAVVALIGVIYMMAAGRRDAASARAVSIATACRSFRCW
jgi:hypothetical protein